MSKTTPSMLPSYAMRTDPGQVRRGNEDACAADPVAGVYVVCDGMGGAAAGEVASQMAAERFLEELRTTGLGRRQTDAEESVRERLVRAVEATNAAVFTQSQAVRKLRGMGTTLVALLLHPAAAPRAIHLLHVGDSRCYRLRGGVLQALTRDHSLVEEQFREGLISRLQAEHSPLRNVITRAIGAHAEVEPEIAALTPEAGDLYLLASDGLTRELTDGEIAEILGEVAEGAGAGGLEAACEALIAAANYQGGNDNITVLILRVG